ncbi:phospholipase D/nuclease [Trichodelitschia bisporula]|uniref:Phospholipase D/nuclease n=1 Tax=Trichodelitschia bisporula TaxID=703511 RepID=A0A6G1HPW7_9PEZI|nr:phospholipase D/nuclease [Trichodelitschia bisporula]
MAGTPIVISDSDSEDEEMKRAIELSLQSPTEVDQHDEELRYAIELSMQTAQAEEASQHAESSERAQETQPAPQPVKPSLSANPLLGLDRKAMEEERLARQAARKRDKSISPPPLRRDNLEVKRPRTGPNNFKAKADTRTLDNGTSAPLTGLRYPNGVLKRTRDPANPTPDDITIEEVLVKERLKTAVFSAFMWDVPWFFSKLDMLTTNMVLVMQGKTALDRENTTRELAAWGLPNVRLCFPPQMGPYTCMHSKLMLLFYETHMRIVVPSANLLDFDWGETGIMENTVFLIDLPRLGQTSNGEVLQSEDDLTFFGKELLHFIKAQGLQERVWKGVLNFDFSKTNHLAFVHSIYGGNMDVDALRTGFPGLARAIKNLGLQTEDTEVDFAASSIGSLDDLYISNIYRAAQGKFTMPSEAKARLAASKHSDHFRLYFPTHDTVARSRGGIRNGGTVCFQRSYWEKPTFPHGIFRDYVSTRPGLLSHNKLLFARGHNKDKEKVAWVYAGSANCSSSAWGRLTQPKASLKLTCSNWECGVIFPVDASDRDLSDLGKAFEGVIVPPFEYPSTAFGERMPWFFMERH